MATKRGQQLTPRTGYNPKTASRSFMQSRPAAKTVNTSVQAERQIKQPPQPFQNKMGAAKTQPPTHPQYRSTGNPKELSYKTSNRYSVHNGTSMPDDMLAAVGYTQAAIQKARGYRERDGVNGRPNGGGRNAGMPGTKNQNTSRRENTRLRQAGY